MSIIDVQLKSKYQINTQITQSYNRNVKISQTHDMHDRYTYEFSLYYVHDLLIIYNS